MNSYKKNSLNLLEKYKNIFKIFITYRKFFTEFFIKLYQKIIEKILVSLSFYCLSIFTLFSFYCVFYMVKIAAKWRTNEGDLIYFFHSFVCLLFLLYSLGAREMSPPFSIF